MQKLSIEDCKKFKGYLKKKSPKKLAGFQNRFFKILDGKSMVYSEKETDKTPKGIVKISQIESLRNDPKDDTIFIFDLEGRDFILKASSKAEKETWVYVLTELKKLSTESVPAAAPNNNDQEKKSLKKNPSMKANRIETADKETINLLLQTGLLENEDSKKNLSAKGIDKILNLKDPKIISRIHYGFLWKKHKSKDLWQRRWFFIYSHRPLSNEKYETDDTNIDKTKSWLNFECLYYFKPDKSDKGKIDDDEDDKENTSHYLDMSNSHQIDISDKDNKFYIFVDVEDRRYEFYTELQGERDRWLEILKNARRTAKEYKMSVTKHPRNIELLDKKFTKGGANELNQLLEKEFTNVVGSSSEIQDFNILEFSLDNLENLVENTVDGCSSNSPPKTELAKNYSEFMNNKYLSIIKNYWMSKYKNFDNEQILKIALRMFNYSKRLEKIRLTDPNLDKNGKEFVKIYMKKIFKNTLDLIENILKTEREKKSHKDSEGYLITIGPDELFNLITRTFDFIKSKKNIIIYEQSLNLFNELIIQYLIGVDCVISNNKIIVDQEFLIAIANNSDTLFNKLSQLIEICEGEGVLSEKEIEDSIHYRQINNSIILSRQTSLARFVDSHNEQILSLFTNKNFLEIDIKGVLTKIQEIFKKYNDQIKDTVSTKCWEEILKANTFYYIRSLLTTAHKKVKNIEELREKIKSDKEIMHEAYKEVVGENLTQLNLKILSDINDFLEVSSFNISSSCLTLREYIGKSFTLNTAKALINLRCDFSPEDKKDAIQQCKEVITTFVDKGNKAINFFAKMESDIIQENDDILEKGLKDIDEKKEEEKTDEVKEMSLDAFFGEDDEDNMEEDKNKNNSEEIQIIDDNKGVSDISYEGTMKKKKHSSWQERFFQLKNGYLYWYKDSKSSIIQNKISIHDTLRVESHKPKKFLMVVKEGKKAENGNVYKFACNNDQEKEEWIKAITQEMKRLKGEEQANLEKIELSHKKKVITDLFNLPSVGKNRGIIKEKVEKSMKNENYFKPVVITNAKLNINLKLKLGKDSEENNNINTNLGSNTSAKTPKEEEETNEFQPFDIEKGGSLDDNDDVDKLQVSQRQPKKNNGLCGMLCQCLGIFKK